MLKAQQKEEFMKRQLLAVTLIALALSGCGFRHIAKVENGGQSFADIRMQGGTSVDVNTLAPRDTVIVANDGGRAVSSSTNLVSIDMMESASIPIGFGIPDFDLRFGWMFKPGASASGPDASKNGNSGKSEPAKVFQLESRKLVSLNGGPWLPGGAFELTQKHLVDGYVPARFKITAANSGNRDFDGPMSLYDRLPSNIKYVKQTRVSRVKDFSTAKAILAFIPIVGIFTEGMDKFQVAEGAVPNVNETLDAANRVLKFDFAQFVMKPGEGIEVEFEAHVMLPRDEDLIKARLKPPPQRR
jgi:hypothetical protein